MPMPSGASKPRNLHELTVLVDELLESLKVGSSSSTKEHLVKALECIENYKGVVGQKHVSELAASEFEEGFIYYNAASRILSDLIPRLDDYRQLKQKPSLYQFYADLINYLVRQRPTYEAMKQHIRGSSDSLVLRLQTLKSGTEIASNGSTHKDLTQLFDSFGDAVSVSQLSSLLKHHSDLVLLIDLRRKREFELEHIDLADSIIQLEPVSIRDSYTCHEIEKYSMITDTDEERELFAQRDRFELVVVLDYSSTKESKSPELTRLISILTTKNAGVFLKRHPVFLDGGYKAWSESRSALSSPIHGLRPVYGRDRSESISSISGRDDITVTRRTSYSERSLIKNVGEFLSSQSRTQSSESSVEFKAPAATPSHEIYSRRDLPSPKPEPSVSSSSPLRPSPAFLSPVPLPRSRSSPPKAQLPKVPSKPASSPAPVSRSSSVFQNSLSVITGLANLGNSCYMNSALQCLIGSKRLTEFFIVGTFKQHINMSSRLGSKGILANEFSSLLTELYKKSTPSRPQSVTPRHFRKVIASLNSMYRTLDQQDCSEFLNYALDSLHEDLNENGNHPKLPELSKEEEEKREKLPIRIASTIEWERYLKTNFSIVVDIFQGQIMSQLRCLKCSTTSTTYNAFSTLSLPIPENGPKSTLGACFDEFVKPELLDNDNAWLCPHCKTKQRTLKHLQISRLPQVLIIHLKRFKMGNYLTKLNTYIDYPLELQLDKYWPNVENELERVELSRLPIRGQVPPFRYRLYGVINHFGNLINGHYTAFVEKGPGNGWCLFDDEKVYKNCAPHKVVNGDAYMLFYERV
ncbi:hypothetical protein KL933_001208 [Ogataea haglerorum]|uniref:Ubiquitin carboxyl-terminal hydrolase n=1 Tax=Ogataea haglerorum TaxID=1937702 RepID=A0AAN6DAR3_9ASCO|nr:uncharacterized protein KL911_001864 [Ogataea haglerorum]KAG7699445.1 hypothetical protein KL951_001162 [Ogataea haglerorum]KAG7721112.1 hypothetical protein KL913_000848 [Ogataea haglerorum]KAG7721866.1 hypothetical protein KL949_000844 [Ogataea haglerorum]KAG7730128.1 hypothetical protein KL933_001208 [Ogataea haglerorum]KAG7732445.1 hypothetical protein KL948_001875 [Ogataea haglerorum]